MSRGWRFDAMHVPGALNDATDGVSRCDQSVVHANLARTHPHILHISGMCGSWGRTGSTPCASVLASPSSEVPPCRRMSALTKGCIFWGV